MESVYGLIEHLSAERIVHIMNTATKTNVNLLRLIKSRRNRQISRVAILLLHMFHSRMCLCRYISWYKYIELTLLGTMSNKIRQRFPLYQV